MLDDLFLYVVYVSFWVVNMVMLRIKVMEVFNFCVIICFVVILFNFVKVMGIGVVKMIVKMMKL